MPPSFAGKAHDMLERVTGMDLDNDGDVAGTRLQEDKAGRSLELGSDASDAGLPSVGASTKLIARLHKVAIRSRQNVKESSVSMFKLSTDVSSDDGGEGGALAGTRWMVNHRAPLYRLWRDVVFAAALVSFFTLPVMMSFLEVWGKRAGAIAVASMSASPCYPTVLIS